MESDAFISLIFTFFTRERLSRARSFALCVNMLLLEFWHVRLVSCSLHCLLLFSDKLCNSSYPQLSKEKDGKLRESRDVWTKDEAVMDPESKSRSLIPVLGLHRGANLPRSDGDHDAAPRLIPQAPAPGERWDVPALPCLPSWKCLCSHMRVSFKNHSSNSQLKRSKNETVQTPLQRHLCEIYIYLIYETKRKWFYPIHGLHDLLFPSFHIFHLHYGHENTHRRSLRGFGLGELFGLFYPKGTVFLLCGHTAMRQGLSIFFVFFQVYLWFMSYLSKPYIYIFSLLNILLRWMYS